MSVRQCLFKHAVQFLSTEVLGSFVTGS
uniref:Uncharacterized protein n=1 Tax=Anguilla anguilla TaxID=7936 RepID=A0A0E9SJC6_ANGAN